jgi:tetratricopeptide (TPR) repeat protein
VSELKDKGIEYFKSKRFEKAIESYRHGLVALDGYGKKWAGNLPSFSEWENKQEQLDRLKPDQMFLKEFNRLKATLHNNIASSFCQLGEFKLADKSNNLAMMEDPEYAKVFYRRIIIL